MDRKPSRTRRTWLASCASTAAGVSILAGCTSDSSEPADDESENDDVLPADRWPMYGVDPQNTGYHPTATGPTSEDVRVRKLFDGEGSISNSPIVVERVPDCSSSRRKRTSVRRNERWDRCS